MNLYQARGELRGMNVKEFVEEIGKQLELVSPTPGEWKFSKLAPGVDPVKWFADCLAKSPGENTWMCFRGDVDGEGNMVGYDAPLMAITGNGSSSESRAMFLAFCRNVLPSAYWLIEKLIESINQCPKCGQLLDSTVGGEYPCPKCGTPTSWDEESRIYILESLMREAVDNCETCRKIMVANVRCARCQSFIAVLK